MATDLCRGWSEMDLVSAWCASTDLQRSVLGYIAAHPGCCLSEVAEDLGRSQRSIQAALATWARYVTGPLGVRDRNGRASVPWNREWDESDGCFRYRAPEEVRAVIGILDGSDGTRVAATADVDSVGAPPSERVVTLPVSSSTS
jgi:hypothetical protein